MLFTSPLAQLAVPDEQVAQGHGLTFSSNRFDLTPSNTSPPVGMDGFRVAAHNADCRYSFFLTLGFTAAPASWRVELRNVGDVAARYTTWQARAAGNWTAGGILAAQNSNAAAARNGTELRLLAPASAANSNFLRIELGAADIANLRYAVFSRVIAALHPSPRIGAELAPEKKTTPALAGHVLSTLESPDPLFRARLQIDAWEDERDLIDTNSLATAAKFACWPSGLQTQFTASQAVLYRRPSFARNMVVTKSTGLRGADGLDAPGGPAGIRLDLREAF